jgi:CDP-diacylglycerol--glycerol-3-phosphate 3-phosphatidyltransferase
MTLPDKLTLSRIPLTFLFMLFLFSHGLPAKVLALATFILASFTDLLDGLIAKRKNISTDFGKMMDPIADKVLVLAAFLAFVQMELVPAWMVVIIIFREAAITGLRISALTRGRVIPADDGGKHKMVSQVVAIFVILVFIILKEARVHPAVYAAYKDAIFILMLITTALTLTSGISYLVRNREVYFNEKAH